MAQKAPNLRPHNLSHVQPGTTDYTPADDGSEIELADKSDRVKIAVTDGKSGSITTKSVRSESMPNFSKSESGGHYD